MGHLKRWFTGLAAACAALGLVAFAASPTVAQYGMGDDDPKAKVGQKAPDFTLTDLKGNEHTLSDFTADGKIVVLEWWNPGCPYVVKHHDKMTTMNDLASKYADEVVWIKVNSTRKGHPNHGMDREYVQKWNVSMPVLLDESGKVGKMYDAKVTPHMYIIDTEGMLRYQGAIDSDRGARPYDADNNVTNYVDQALQQIIDGSTVTTTETRPYGCSIKYAG